jgi:leader peptidase (prepilin peptidase)/N-methyltransferase
VSDGARPPGGGAASEDQPARSGPPVRVALVAAVTASLAGAIVWLVLPLASWPPLDAAGLTAFSALFAGLAAWIVVSDLRLFEIPDEANVLLLLGGLVWCALTLAAQPAQLLMVDVLTSDAPLWFAHAAGVLDGLARGVVAAGSLLAVRILYRRLRGIDGLGLGDVKLAGAAAPWLVWSDLPAALLVAVLAALAATIAASVIGRRGLDRAAWIPLGAFLAPAAYVVWLLRLAGLPLGLTEY